MGTTAQKLEYLGTTKSQLKDMINYGLPTENQITNETTFREYVSSIFEAFLESLRDSTTLYTNLPKISGNGTQITLNDTANAPMRITLNPTALSQDGTPTPSSPQDIHTISGDNEIVVCGKNLLVPITQETKNSVSLSLNGTAITLNGTASNATNIGTTYITLPAGTYKFCKKYISGTTSGSVQILARKQGSSVNISQIGFNDTTYSDDQYSTLTLTEKTTIYYYIYFANGRVLTNLKFNLQLVKSDTADYDFEPYVSQVAPLNLPVENLFNKNNANILNAAFGDALTTSVNAKTLYISCKPNTTYTVSKISSMRFKVGTTATTPAVGVAISNRISDDTGANITITTSSTAQYLVVYYFLNGTDTLTEQQIIDSIQIEYGSKANTYTPYGTTPLEYCKIGDYEDKFIRTSGKNLLNPNVATSNCSVDTTTGIITITANSTDTYIKGVYVYTDANKFLTLPSGSYYIKSTNSKVRITLYSDGSGLDTAANQPITLSSETNFGGLRIRSTDSSSLQNVSFGIMISTTDTPYEPYGTGQWYLKKNIGKYVANNDLVINGEITENYVPLLTPILNISPNLNAADLQNISKNNMLQIYNSTTYSGQNGTTSTGKVRIILSTTYANTGETANTFFANNNFTLYYALATPEYILLNNTLQTQLTNIYKNMLSYKGTTNVSQVNNDLPFVMSISALEDLN